MEIGRKLHELRRQNHLSQADIEHKTGLLRCYTSRVENGYTVPSVETLEKYANAFGIPLYRLFTGGELISMPKLPATTTNSARQIDGKHQNELHRFLKALKQMNERNQKLLLGLAQAIAGRRQRKHQIR